MGGSLDDGDDDDADDDYDGDTNTRSNMTGFKLMVILQSGWVTKILTQK